MTFRANLAEIVNQDVDGLLACHRTWVRIRLGDVCSIINGFPFASDRFNMERGFPLLRIRNVGKDDTDTRFDGSFDPAFVVQPGELLVGMDGDFRCAKWRGAPALLNQRVCKLTPDERFLSLDFLTAALGGYLSAIHKHTSAITVKHLSSNTIADIPLAFPPRPEQDRIAQQLSSQLTRLDDAIATLERVERNLKRYKASVLKAAVEGRLVPTEAALAKQEGRDYEPASDLLERILAERQRRWFESGKKGTYQEPAPPNNTDLSDLPQGWCWAAVEQLGSVVSGQTPNGIAEALLPEGDVPWFRVGDMNTPGNEHFMIACSSYLTGADASRLGVHVRPEGTIIFPKRGGAIATNKKRRLSRPSAYDLNTMGIVPVDLSAAYLWTWFAQIDLATLSDGSNVPQINHGDIAPLCVPLPPLAEQQRIIVAVDDALSVADAARSTVQRNRIRASRLRQSILKWAFEGKLADQDPNDEPASVLLERIRFERNTPKPAAITRPQRSNAKKKART